jgi:hypothetical protein
MTKCTPIVNINKNKKFWEELSHLFEVLEPHLMERNVSELTLT